MSANDFLSSAEHLVSSLSTVGPLVIAFSGGVDSSLLAVAARKALGRDQVLAVTADSESFASGELELCAELTKAWDIEWQTVSTSELSDERYLINDTDRCYWCKTALMDQLEPLANARGASVALGVNVDDLDDHRPGQQAAASRGAIFPLVTANLNKSDIRGIAKLWDITTWDRPAMPCLASRIPYGTEVSISLLSRVDRAESALRSLGFDDVRVRHYDETARIELPADRLCDAADQAEAITTAVSAIGYRYVTLDLAGLRSGNLNGAKANET